MKYTLITRMKMTADILAKYDPMHLISAGAPVDEYESEAISIIQNLTAEGRPSHADIYYWCEEVFEELFAPASIGNIDWEPIVKEIFEVFQ